MGLFSWLFSGGPKPIALKGEETYEFEIVGEARYQRALEAICGGRTEDGAEEYCQATLILEDKNPYDNKAVRVDIEGKAVGYLSRKDARAYRKRLREAGFPNSPALCDAVIVGGWDRGPDDRGHFGVKLDLPSS